MTAKEIALSTSLKRLGFTRGNQMRLYGAVFEFLSEPIVISDEVVLLDATDKKTGQTRKVRVPLPIVNMAGGSPIAA